MDARTQARPRTKITNARQVPGTDADDAHRQYLRGFADGVWRQFKWVNVVVLGSFVTLFVCDLFLFLSGWITADQRIIGERSMLALIAGSTAQLGALAIAIGRGLFAVGRRSPD